MSDIDRLAARFRAITWAGISVLVLTAIIFAVIPSVRYWTEGLLLGELGGAYVVYSMIRQGHLRDNMQGNALMLSGMLGMFTRLVVLAVVMFVALKTHISVVTTLCGYLLGFVLIFVGLFGYARNQ